jgi:hypothetical protein
MRAGWRDALDGPLLERGAEALVQRLLRESKSPSRPHQRGEHAARFVR